MRPSRVSWSRRLSLANNMLVATDNGTYLLAGPGLGNLLRALIMARVMGMPVNFTTTGYIGGEGYDYIATVTL